MCGCGAMIGLGGRRKSARDILRRIFRDQHELEGWSMKAAVVGEKGAEVRDLPKPQPKPNEVLDSRARIEPQSRRLVGRLGTSARQRRRHRREDRPGVLRRDRGGRQRGQGLQGRRSRPGFGAGRLCRICRHRRGARASHPRQQHDLRAGGVLAGGAADHAQRGRHRRAPQARRNAAHSGRQLRRRPDGHADRQADGRLRRSWARRRMRSAGRG